jgi:transglutaminase-like putative cysteine protease
MKKRFVFILLATFIIAAYYRSPYFRSALKSATDDLTAYFDDFKYLFGADYTGSETVTKESQPTVEDETEYSYSPVTSANVSSYDEWIAALDNCVYQLGDSVTLTIYGYSEDKYNIKDLPYDIAISSNGRKFFGYANITYSFTYTSNFRLIATQRCSDNYSKLTDSEKAAYDKLQAVAQSISSAHSGQFDREKAIHDYLTMNYAYAVGSTSEERSHSIVGFTEDGKGVCEAYADAFTLIGRMCGLEVMRVNGTLNNVGHGWNIVKIGDDYYHIDVTSDDPVPDGVAPQSYKYFNLTDSEILKDHTITSKDLPACTADTYNYHTYNSLVIHSSEELQSLVRRMLRAGKSTFSFKAERITIPDAETLYSYFNNSGYSRIEVSGDFGKEGVFTVRLI